MNTMTGNGSTVFRKVQEFNQLPLARRAVDIRHLLLEAKATFAIVDWYGEGDSMSTYDIHFLFHAIPEDKRSAEELHNLMHTVSCFKLQSASYGQQEPLEALIFTEMYVNSADRIAQQARWDDACALVDHLEGKGAIVEPQGRHSCQKVLMPLPALALEEFFENLIDHLGGAFNGNDEGSSGQMYWDLETNKVEIDSGHYPERERMNDGCVSPVEVNEALKG